MLATMLLAFGGFVAAKAEGEAKIESASLVLMQEDRTTVLTIAADYRGPAGDMALIIPVPQRVRAQAVRTLEAGVIERLEQLTAPRMSEVQETDPCEEVYSSYRGSFTTTSTVCGVGAPVIVEYIDGVPDRPIATAPQFVQGPYAITVVRDSTGEEIATWLREHDYVVPEQLDTLMTHAEPGRHFVIAELPASAIAGHPDEHGLVTAQLQPLQISYERDGLIVPMRFVSANAGEDERDLVVHVIASTHVRPLDRPFVVLPSDVVVNERTYGELDSFHAGVLGLVGDNVAIEYVQELTSTRGYVDTYRPITLDDLDSLGLSELRSAGRWQEMGGYNREIYGLIDELVVTRLRVRTHNAVADLELGAYVPGLRSVRTQYQLLHHFPGPVECPHPHFGDFEPRIGKPTFTSFPERQAADPQWWSYLEYPEQLDALIEVEPPVPQTGKPSHARGSAHCSVDPEASFASPLLLVFALVRRRVKSPEPR
jgi:hypothetical protein